MDGGGGSNWISYDQSASSVWVNLATGQGTYGDAQGDTFTGFNNVIGSAGNDGIWGNNNGDVLNGGAGNDYIIGGAGNDIIVGGAGADYIDGGGGFNWASYDQSTSQVWVNLTSNVNLAGDAQGDLLYNIQAIKGSSYGDALFGDANVNILDGAQGNDYLWGGAGTDYFQFDGTTWGQDEVADFTPGTDVLVLSSAAFANFAAVSSHMTQSGSNTIITYDSGDTVKLDNIDHTVLASGNFLFA